MMRDVIEITKTARHEIKLSDEVMFDDDSEVTKCGCCGCKEHLDVFYAILPEEIGDSECRPEDFWCAYCLISKIHDEGWILKSLVGYIFGGCSE